MEKGFDWNLTDNPLVQLTIKSLKKKYPTSNVLQKVPPFSLYVVTNV
jgi:hypothetical protein